MSRNHGLKLALIGAAAAAALAGCGKQGVLEQPAPLFGSRAKAQYDAEKAQEAKDEAQRRAATHSTTTANDESAGDNAPRTTRDVLDPGQKREPASHAPILGAPNPLGSPVDPSR